MNKNMKNIKLIILDIDKTITNKENEITEYTKKVLQQAVKKGMYVILCSGRTNEYVVAKSKELEITPMVISSNGTLVYDYQQQKNIYIDSIERREIEKILNYATEFQINCKLNAITTRYHNKLVPVEERNDSKSLEELKNKPEEIVQIFAYHREYESINKFIEKIINKKKYNIENNSSNLVKKPKKDDNFFWVDIIKNNNSKGKAISKLREYLNIKKEETICFGDHINDFNMFQYCGITCAVGNAMDELKKQADYITLPSEEDGVAKFIEEHILNN